MHKKPPTISNVRSSDQTEEASEDGWTYNLLPNPMANIFVSYSRADREFVQRVNLSLKETDKDVWIDWEDIPATAEWMAEIFSAIAAADSFVFVLSPESIKSATCLEELARAVELNKRLIPILCRNVNPDAVPESIRRLQWIDFRQETDFLRGYAAGLGASRRSEQNTDGFGLQLKEQILNPKLGVWNVGSHMMGETIPKESNYVALDSRKDKWDMPLLKISVAYDDNDEKMIADYFEQLSEMFTLAGFKDIKTTDSKAAPGLDIHEMGGVRMGRDPKTSLLNKWNQLHHCGNVFVTDGACMTSTSTQNPSLTYMALTARAADHAVNELKKGNL